MDMEVVHKGVNEMLKQDITATSSSQWSSPIVLIGKRDGSKIMSPCKVNHITKKDANLLPTGILVRGRVFSHIRFAVQVLAVATVP